MSKPGADCKVYIRTGGTRQSKLSDGTANGSPIWQEVQVVEWNDDRVPAGHTEAANGIQGEQARPSTGDEGNT